MWLLPIGWVAGVVTTVAGAGGGVFLLLLLTLLLADPLQALAIATPALMVGNAHRTWLYRRSFSRKVGLPWAGAGLVGALMGGALAVSLPGWVLQGGMVLAALAAVLNQGTAGRFALPLRAAAPLGLAVGIASTAGGAGILANPALQAMGLRGATYLAVMSFGSLSMHIGRLVGLWSGGVMDGSIWVLSAWLAVAIPVGNASGHWLRTRFGDDKLARFEVVVSASLVALSLGGMVR